MLVVKEQIEVAVTLWTKNELHLSPVKVGNMASIIHQLKEKPSVWWSDITLGRQIRQQILCFCPVRGFGMINLPYIFPRLQLFVGDCCRVIHSNKWRACSSSPFNTSQAFFCFFIPVHIFLKINADECLLISVFQELHLQPHSILLVPLSCGIQHQSRCSRGTIVLHTKPVFSW